ncbi:glycosyltransferase family protein [Pedobacter arcticus]|uniref:glycosyltransferase family protein n=1 Tax=Pedobacter arcticus TaxID=752140 RepID=UPI0002EAB5B5|nr:glycosyltransferase [Pedobacter arcticus]
MRVAYIINQNNPYTYAGITVANGFRNAFLNLGHVFEYFDIKALKSEFWKKKEFNRLLSYDPDLIFASVDDLNILNLKLLPPTKFVLWGAFYKECNYEGQAQTVLKRTKRKLNDFSNKHHIIIWAQHSEQLIEDFFSGYRNELGLKIIQLMHCADDGKIQQPQLHSDYDFLWIGNISHRLETYKEFIEPLKTITANYKEYTEHNKIAPEEVENQALYKKAFLSPNVHTKAQIQFNMGLNERVFSSSLMGGFQICDNNLAKNYFQSDELIVLSRKDEFIDAFYYYKDHPSMRLEMILKMQQNILKNHTYKNRIAQIFDVMELT